MELETDFTQNEMKNKTSNRIEMENKTAWNWKLTSKRMK